MECNEFCGNHFSMCLFRKIILHNENGCFSPLALEAAWNLLGKVGLLAKLGEENDNKGDKNYHINNQTDYKDEQTKFDSFNENLKVVNKLFVSKECNIRQMPNSKNNDDEDISIQLAPFGQNSEITRQKLNCWAFKASYYKLKTLVPPFTITDTTQAVVINFLNFHSNWKQKCDLNSVKKCLFHSSPNVTNLVDMMSVNNVKFLYSQNDDCQVLGIPYSMKDVVLFVILPKDRYGLPWLIRNYDIKSLMGTLSSTTLSYVDVELPVFRFESFFNFGKDFLISVSKNSNKCVNDDHDSCFVLHHSMFEITVNGTNETLHNITTNEAKIAEQPESKCSAQFYAHHSFLFVVVDVKKDQPTILFLGQYCGNNGINNDTNHV